MIIPAHDHVQTINDGVEARPVGKVHRIQTVRASTTGSGLRRSVKVLIDNHIEAQQLTNNAIDRKTFDPVEDRSLLIVLQRTDRVQQDRADHELGIRRPVLLRQGVDQIDNILVTDVIRADRVAVGRDLVIRRQRMQARSAARAAIAERRGRERATSVGRIRARVLVQTAQTISATGRGIATSARLIVVLDHGLRFFLRKFHQHVVNDISFQAVDVVQRSGTNRELDIDVLEHDLPNGRVFSGGRAVVLDSITPLSARIAGFDPELVGRTIRRHGPGNSTHRVRKTQRNEHRIVSSPTAFAVAACRQGRRFSNVSLILRLISEHLQFALENLLATGELFELLAHRPVDIHADRLGNRTNDRRSLDAGNFRFQRGNLLIHLGLSRINGFRNLGRNLFDLSQIGRFDSVQFLNNLFHFKTLQKEPSESHELQEPRAVWSLPRQAHPESARLQSNPGQHHAAPAHA